MNSRIISLLILCHINKIFCNDNPVVVTTWNNTRATQLAWEVLSIRGRALDAVEKGCAACQELQCDHTVGYGGSPDENGETTLDAFIMDGDTIDVGSVMSLRRIKNAVAVARAVLDHTEHSILAGNLATDFAVQMNFTEESLQTDFSANMWKTWKDNKCQPNFWKDVSPDPKTTCGPYKRSDVSQKNKRDIEIGKYNHDTIGIIALDQDGSMAAATSTNGARHKIPGRVGDSPIPGSGGYADSEVGAAAATGDGDVMLRFLPSFLAVEEMRRGKSPTEAANEAIRRIVKRYPQFFGAVIALNKDGEYGAACNHMEYFPFVVGNGNNIESVSLETVRCLGQSSQL